MMFWKDRNIWNEETIKRLPEVRGEGLLKGTLKENAVGMIKLFSILIVVTVTKLSAFVRTQNCTITKFTACTYRT